MNSSNRPISSLNFAIFFSIPFLFLAFWSIWASFSYWFDELFSVTTSLMPFREMVDEIMRDVHPPLYQVLLKYWIEFFGHAEPQTRSFSFLAAFSTMIALIVGLRKQPITIVLPAVVFLGSAWLFTFYAQETRSYALLMFLAMIATLLDLHRYNQADNLNRFVWYAILLVLSLTHYFGLIYAGILLISDLLQTGQIRFAVERLLLGALIMIWPLIHYFLGDIAGKTAGNFWIKSEGLKTTLLTFGNALLATPVKIYMLFGLPSLAAWVLNGLLLFFFLSLSIFKAKPEARIEIGRFSLYVFGFLAVVSIIDMHTPISTGRNFIVLLPLLTILFAEVFHVLWSCYSKSTYRFALLLAVIGYVIASTYTTFNSMQSRWGPRQNWKSLASTVENLGICNPHCWFFGSPVLARLYSYYFGPSMVTEPFSEIRSLSQLVEMSAKNTLPIIAAHFKQSQLEELINAYPSWKCLEPNQSWKSSVILLIPDVSSIPGLKSCL